MEEVKEVLTTIRRFIKRAIKGKITLLNADLTPKKLYQSEKYKKDLLQFLDKEEKWLPKSEKEIEKTLRKWEEEIMGWDWYFHESNELGGHRSLVYETPLTCAIAAKSSRAIKTFINSCKDKDEFEGTVILMNRFHCFSAEDETKDSSGKKAASEPTMEELSLAQKWGQTPLHYACDCENLTAVNLIADLVPEIFAQQVLTPSFDFEISYKQDPKSEEAPETSHRLWDQYKFPEGITFSDFLVTRVLPLHIACRRNAYEIAKKLLESQAHEEQQVIAMKNVYLVSHVKKSKGSGNYITLTEDKDTFHNQLYKFLDKEAADLTKESQKSKKNYELQESGVIPSDDPTDIELQESGVIPSDDPIDIKEIKQKSFFKSLSQKFQQTTQDVKEKLESIAIGENEKKPQRLVPGKNYMNYNPLYIMLNMYYHLQDSDLEKNVDERIDTIKKIVTKLYDVEHFREMREINAKLERKKELSKSKGSEVLATLYYGRLLNETHVGHSQKEETCLLFSIEHHLWEVMNHAVVDRAIEEYWRHAPIGRKFENQKYPILSKLKKWYSTARYQFYLGFFLYAIFLAFFTTLLSNLAGNSVQSFYYAEDLRQLLVDNQFPYSVSENPFGDAFITMTRPDQIWEFLNGSLSQGLFGGGPLIDRYGVLIGTPIIRQFRVTPNASCEIPEECLRYTNTCYSTYSVDVESKNTYGSGYFYTPPSMGALWQSFLGYWYPYDGGYVYELNSTSINNLYANWIDTQSLAIAVEFTLYNPNLNLFCMTRHLIEMPPSGFVQVSWTYVTGKLVYYQTPLDKFMASIEVSLVILFIIFVGIEISEMKNEKWDYLKNKWNYLEDSAYILFFVCVCIQIVILVHCSQLPLNNLSSVDQGELLFIANLQNQEANFASVLAIIFWFRLVKFLRAMSLFKHNGDKFSLGKRLPLGVLMKITFQMVNDVVNWLIIYGVTTIGFSLALYSILSVDVYDFRTWGTSLVATILMTLGNFNWDAVQQTNHLFALAFFFIYLILSVIILLNLLIAMFGRSFSELYDRAIQEFRLEWALIVFSYTSHRAHYENFIWPTRENKDSKEQEAKINTENELELEEKDD